MALPVDPMVSRPFRLVGRRQDTADTVTLTLEPLDGAALVSAPGQFTMIGILGVGEVPISVSGDEGRCLVHTIRDAGGVTHALVQAQVGDLLDVRGPYGIGWGVEDGRGGDIVFVAGGIGLAPLRPAILSVLAAREQYRNVALLYGARSPGDLLFLDELDAWRDRGIEVAAIVDHGTPDWPGRVGLVTTLIPKADFDPGNAMALVCGPEVMMHLAVATLIDRGLAAQRIRLSLERSMKCGVGLCGHCQLRELFICIDGPVLDYARVAPLMAIREA